jgi:hypothetical protein
VGADLQGWELMPNTQYKKTTPLPLAVKPSPASLSDPSELLRPPFVRASTAQDTVLGARRVLVSRHGGGSDEWLVGNTTPGQPSQTFPDPNAWRDVSHHFVRMHPGQTLVFRVLATPSGATEVKPIGLPWKQHGVQGRVRAVITWTDESGATATATATAMPAAAPDAEGAEETGPAASWAQVQHLVVPVVRPSGAGVDLAIAEQWSEFVMVEVLFQDQGGARIIHATLSEETIEHVALHSNRAVTINGAPQSGAWPNKYPQEEHEDGATYQEHRFGVHRALAVAERQTREVGPKIAAWSAYTEAAALVTGVAVPKDITSTTPVRISAGPNTAWDADAVGFDITMSARAPENLPTRVSGAASCPVLILLYCRYNQAGANTGVVRIQSSPRSYVEVKVKQSVVGTTWQWVGVRGWLETNIASDDAHCVIQDFGQTTGDTLQILAWDISYGDSPVGISFVQGY